MTIEGLGKKFQEARRARNLTLDEAARMTKIRPARLAEIEAEAYSQFAADCAASGRTYSASITERLHGSKFPDSFANHYCRKSDCQRCTCAVGHGCANADSSCRSFRTHSHRAGGPTSRTCTPR